MEIPNTYAMVKANVKVAPKKRLEIYKNFKKYLQHKDTRSMDDICMSGTTEFQTEFQLQSQQKFLAEYMIAYPNWDKLLLYHQIGSGKTCTAITMAEEYLKTYPKNKINVVLPARLKSNFIDELISPCGFGKYISNEDFIKFNDSATSENAKKQIRTRFMKAIEEKYNIMSFEKLKIIH
jgi:DNA polymerase III delta prime subunit